MSDEQLDGFLENPEEDELEEDEEETAAAEQPEESEPAPAEEEEAESSSDEPQRTPWERTASGAVPFVHLHTHSHYSLLDGIGKLDALIERAKELEMPAMALTDHGNMYGALEI